MNDYQPPKHGFPERNFQKEQAHGFLFIACFIYAPTILFVLGTRATMLYYNTPIIHLNRVDAWLLKCIRVFENYIFYGAGLW